MEGVLEQRKVQFAKKRQPSLEELRILCHILTTVRYRP